MRTLALISSLLLSACSASADLPDAATPSVESVEFDPTAARVDDLDARLRALRQRLDTTDLDADVVSQALDVHRQVLDTLEDIVRDLDDRAEAAESLATVAQGLAEANEDINADQAARLQATEDTASDAITRLARLESAPVGLREVDIDSGVCGLDHEDGGVIYRVAPDVRPGELLLRAGGDASLRVEVPVAVTCGSTSVGEGGDLSTAPAAVVDGGSVYVEMGGGDWFRVAR